MGREQLKIEMGREKVLSTSYELVVGNNLAVMLAICMNLFNAMVHHLNLVRF